MIPWYTKALIYIRHYFDTLVHFLQYDIKDATVDMFVDALGYNPFAYFGLFALIYFVCIQDILSDPNCGWKRKFLVSFIFFISFVLFLFFVFIYHLAFGS